MRSRAELKKSFDSTQDKTLDVLLDIRDLLKKKKVKPIGRPKKGVRLNERPNNENTGVSIR